MAKKTKLKTIPLNQIFESPTNPRKTFGDLTDLRESIRSVGIIHKPLVRLMPDGDGFELIVGHRRRRALLELGETETECEVGEYSDKEVLEIQLVENIQRADVPPLEEAAALRALHDQHGYTYEELAAKVGKSVRVVASRVRLMALCQEAHAALEDGRLLLGAADWLARLEDHDEQRGVLRDLMPNWGDDTPKSASRARTIVEGVLRKLKDAPFDVAAAELVPEAGACTSCPKRTCAQGALFGDDLGTEDRCTDGGCWKTKVRAHGELRAKEAKAEGLTVLSKKQSKEVFAWNGTTVSHGWVDLEDKSYEAGGKKWKSVLKKAEVKPTIAFDADGQAHEVVRREDAQRAAKAAAKAEATAGGKASSGSSSADSAAKAARAKQRLEAEVHRRVVHEIAVAAEDTWGSPDLGDHDQLIELLAPLVAAHTHHDAAKACVKRRELTPPKQYGGQPDVRAAVEKLAKQLQPGALIGLMLELLVGDGYDAKGRAKKLASALDVDVGAITKQVRAELTAKKKAKPAKAKAAKASKKAKPAKAKAAKAKAAKASKKAKPAKASKKSKAKLGPGLQALVPETAAPDEEAAEPTTAREGKTNVKGAELVLEVGLLREEGWLYYLDKDCNIARSQTRKGKKRQEPTVEVVYETNVVRDTAFLYFLGEDGDLYRRKLGRGLKASAAAA